MYYKASVRYKTRSNERTLGGSMVDLSFPDKARGKRGEWVMETVNAMRAAKGDRSVAAKALGIGVASLASRIHRIRTGDLGGAKK